MDTKASARTRRFEDALLLAVRLHAAQTRKGGRIPYIAHLLGVASIALQYGADEDEAIAALLHDSIEDQGGKRTGELVREQFGERVAEIVYGCTDSEGFFKPPWRKRKEEYIAHLRDAAPSVLLVSAADKLENVRSIVKDLRRIGESVWNRFTGRKEGTLWYYRELQRAFPSAPQAATDERLRPLFDELRRVVMEMELLAADHGGKAANPEP
ncbi:MAG TPA: HD domain-containing protein [Bacteroidota bacterium]|nr:HD domain-containing protein [Bacteroidota bacterium]